MIKYYKLLPPKGGSDRFYTEDYFKIDLDKVPMVTEWWDGDSHETCWENFNELHKEEITESEWLLIKIK